jgi:TrmH family RNA methyltransferase
MTDLAPLLHHRPGEVRRVASAANEAVKAIRALELKKNREASGLFVAEGARTVIEALENGADIRAVAHLEASRAEPHVARIAEAVVERGGLVLEVNAQALEKISRRDNPQTVIGVFAQGWRDLGDIDLSAMRRAVALERVRDPGNLGTILRTADALGAGAVVLVGDCTDPYGLDAVRASMGSIFAVPLARTDAAGLLAWASQAGALTVGAHLEGAAGIRAIPWRDPAVLVMGNEQAGLTPELASGCAALARIPMHGRADSLNLAVATGIALYESVRG